MTRSEFLAAVESFLLDTGMLPTTLGKRAVGDPSFVWTLRKGRDPSLGVVERVTRFMSEHRAARASLNDGGEAA